MYKQSIYVAISIILILVAGFSSCKKDDNNSSVDHIAELQIMIDSNWNSYFNQGTGILGGLMLKVNTPSGDYFVSSNYDDTVTDKVFFRGGSTSKMFTAAAIMLLEEQGKLEIENVLTDKIPGTTEMYLPDTEMYNIPYKNEITIKQLMQHIGGVFDITNTPVPDSVQEPYAGMIYNNYIDFVLGDITHSYSFQEFIGVVAKHNLTFGEPGVDFHYSNIGYMILGVIIERVSGMDYTSFIEANFVIPLELKYSSFNGDPTYKILPDPYVHGFLIYDGVPMDVTEMLNQSAGIATGNILTTCNDLNIWTKSLLTGEAGISQERVNEMMKYIETHEGHKYYGLGINFTPGLGFGHNGAVAGYMTITRYNPDNQVVFTINASYSEMEDLYKEGDLLYSIASQACDILGY